MSLLAVIPASSGRSRYSCSPAIGILLVVILSILGMRASSWTSPEIAAHIDDSAHVDDNPQDDAPIADAWNLDDESDENDDDRADDDTMTRSELASSLPPLSTVTRCSAVRGSRYQSFVSEPSTPPPRA
jgi:hypothetical protein